MVSRFGTMQNLLGSGSHDLRCTRSRPRLIPVAGALILVVSFLIVALPVSSHGPVARSPAGTSANAVAGARSDGPLAAAPIPSVSSTAGWSQVPGSFGHTRGTIAMAYDAADGHVLAFGGGGNLGRSYNDTWTYSGGVWTNISATLSVAPIPRESALMAYDAADGYILLFGGYTSISVPGSCSGALNDTWIFQRGAWTQITPTGGVAPPCLFSAAMAYDSADREIVLFGGGLTVGGVLNAQLSDQTWTYASGTWTDLTGSLAAAPEARETSSMADDPRDGDMILYGGRAAPNDFNDTWGFHSSTWTLLSGLDINGRFVGTPGPEQRRGSMMAFDSGENYVVLTQGVNDNCGSPPCTENDTWVFLGGNWTDVSASIGAEPYPPRWSAGVSDDPADRQVVILGGCLAYGCDPPSNLNDSWIFQGTTLHATLQPLGPVVDAGTTLQLQTQVDGGAAPFSYFYTGLPSPCTTRNNATYECTPTTTGDYLLTVRVTDGDGEIYDASASITVAPLLTVTLAATPSLLDLTGSLTVSANVTGGFGAYGYTWSGLPLPCSGITSSTLACTPAFAGTYVATVNVTDGLYTTAQSPPVVISVSSTVIAGIEASQLIGVAPLSIVFTAHTLGGTPGFTYAWDFGDGASSELASVPHTFDAAGSYTVSLEVTDSVGTGVRPTIAIVAVAPLSTTLVVTPALAEVGVSLALSAATVGGDAPLTYTWSGLPPGCVAGNAPAISCTPTASGSFDVFVTVSDALGETATSDQSVTVVARLAGNASAQPEQTCTGLTRELRSSFTSQVSGGVAPLSYSWSFGDGASSNAIAPVHEYATPGNFSALLTVEDALHATLSDPLVVTFAFPPCGSHSQPISFLPTLFAVIGLGVVAALVVAVTVLVVLRRRRRSPPNFSP